jgi:hypothetical protein
MVSSEPDRPSETTIPLREWDGQHGKADAFDPERIRLVRTRWSSQDRAVLERDRTIEENIRMLAGRQWDVWNPLLGQFVDPLRYLPDSEQRWRQRPVVNLLQYWYMLTHARLVENAPVITFQPSTADRKDQLLAETMDTVFKTLWQSELEMEDVHARAAAWLLAAGEVFLCTTATYEGAGSAEHRAEGPAVLSMEGPDGPIERMTDGPVPFGADGQPMASLSEDGQGYDVPEGAEGTPIHEGMPAVHVYSPLEVRSEWGSTIPWTEKRWFVVRSYITPDVVKERYGVDVVPDVGNAGDTTGTAGYLTRMLFGAGNFGSVGTGTTGTTGDSVQSAMQGGEQGGGFVTVDTMWEQPDDEVSPANGDNPGGRLLVVTPSVVLHDSERPYKTAGAGPIRRAQFVQMPGRGGFGSTPLEQMVPIQKTYNRGWAQILEHRNRCTNPILVYDESSGFAEQADNAPGAMVPADFVATNGNPPAIYLVPPPLSGDVWKIQSELLNVLFTMGSLHGAEGTAPTDDASGELVSQLRFNADRPILTAARSLATALAGVGDDLVAVLPTCWPKEKILAYAGEDNVVRTLSVLPEMWEGSVNVRPDLNASRPESQGEKEAKLERWWQEGAFGDPVMEGRQTFLQLVRYPNLGRVSSIDGGVDRTTAAHHLGELAQGTPAREIMLFPQYNYDVLIKVARDHIAAPEFLSYDPPTQQNFLLYFELLKGAKLAQMGQQMAEAAPMLAATGAMQTMAQHGAIGAGAAEAQAAMTPPEEQGPAGSPKDSKAQAKKPAA